jgi:hypothetical protein
VVEEPGSNILFEGEIMRPSISNVAKQKDGCFWERGKAGGFLWI